MFEGFPYTNFHELNLDWIVKIAKDFLDQYTHIQEIIENGEQSLNTTIENGEQSLNTATETGITSLQETKEQIETLLNAWYETHSADIANQLTAALASLATATANSTAEINRQTNAQMQSLLDSIPADVSEILAELDALNKTVLSTSTNYTLTTIENFFFNNSKQFYPLTGYYASIAKCAENDVFIIKHTLENASVYHAYTFLDSNFNVISTSNLSTQGSFVYNVTVIAPANSAYLIVNNGETAIEKDIIRKVTAVAEPELTGIFFDTGVDAPNIYYSTYQHTFVSTADYHCITMKCKPGEVYMIHGCGFQNTDASITTNAIYRPYIVLDANGNEIAYSQIWRGNFLQYDTEIITIPINGSLLCVNYLESAGIGYLKKFGNPNELPKFAGKTIVWFGTSIPAVRLNGVSYPDIVASLLGAKVYNEAIGSSPMSDIVPVNASRMRNLSMTYAEKQVQTWWSELTDAEKLIARNTSFDYVVSKYLPGGSVGEVDYYIFDHGYNDYYANDPTGYDTIPENPTNKHYPIGAATFLIQSILNAYPRKPVLWIGHYEGGLLDPTDHQSWGKPVVELQEKIADLLQIPLCELWKYTGWGYPTKVSTTGYWDNGYWVNSGGTLRQDYVKNCAFADGIHPNTDKSGHALETIASIIANWLKKL